MKITDYTDENHRLHRLRSQITQIIKIFLFFVISQLPVTSYQLPAFAAPHISGKHIRGQPKDHVHKIPDVRQLRAIGLTPKAIQQAIGATGTKKVAVILVDFASADSDTSEANTMTSADITNFNITFSTLTKFYEEVSYGQLNLGVTFFYDGGSTKTLTGSETPYLLSTKSMSWYGQDSDESLAQLVKDALDAAAGAVTKPPYDCVIVAHAGYGNESTNKSGDIWSVFISWIDGAEQGFTEGVIVPAREDNASAIGVTCHEFGHQLGLPDLYNTDTSPAQSVVGKWCLMDFGIWAGSPQGAQPTHPSAWCKQRLQWITTPETGTINEIRQIETNQTKSLYKLTTPVSNEYFLLENRQMVGFDSSLPGSGLLVWHIDDDIATNTSRLAVNTINTGDPHYGIDLEEADSTAAGQNYGDNKDPFYQVNNSSFTIYSIPNSRTYNGADSGIAITGISISGPIMYINLAPELELVKLYNYPNPIYQTYTTIKIVVNKPFSTLPLKIYNLSGELVFEYTLSEKEYKGKENDKYIYKYSWDLKNNNREPVASGIYFYVIKADKEVKVGKLAIIR